MLKREYVNRGASITASLIGLCIKPASYQAAAQYYSQLQAQQQHQNQVSGLFSGVLGLKGIL